MEKKIKNIFMPFFVVFLLIFISVSAFCEALQGDAGIITFSKGNSFYSNAAKQDEFTAISVLMKVRTGDTVKIDKNSELSILYQANGRREVWTGPVKVKITDLKGLPEGGDKNALEPSVSSIPIEISDSIVVASSSDSQTSKTRAGIRVVRGLSETTPTSYQHQGLSIYEKLKKDLGVDDVTPDLYLYAYYKSKGLEKDMRSQAEIITKKWGKSPEMIQLNIE